MRRPRHESQGGKFARMALTLVGVNTRDELGGVKSDYLWQEIDDGKPSMYQVALTSTEPGCTGFKGLDHIVISGPIRRTQAAAPSSSKMALIKNEGQRIVTSDHCPRITSWSFKSIASISIVSIRRSSLCGLSHRYARPK